MTTTSAVEASGVEYRYGNRVALGASSFTIPCGRVTAVIGPNGSGKSTLLNGVAGLMPPSSGDIEVLGKEPESVRRRIAYVLQTARVNESMHVTVREVVTMGRYASLGPFGWLRTEDRDRVEASMDRMGVAELAGRHLHELSGGQRQRVFVAQGLAQNHEVLLLDEPLTALDILSAEMIDGVIHEEQAKGRTVVLTTHDLAEASVADHVLLLNGRVVAVGSPGDVLTAEHLTEAYGPSLLHAEEGRVFLDDPAHMTTEQRHVHLSRGRESGPPER